jgi:adsorption protein B
VESHGKSLVVRESLGASVPSAGVACAFARRALARLERPERGGPFDAESLTEDYEAGLHIRDAGGRGVFVRMRDEDGGLVATRECFPDSFDAAVRQKARWMIGIALAGWDRMGWRGGPAEWWMRMRDRRSALAALILAAAYLTLLLWALLFLLGAVLGQPIPALPRATDILLQLNFCLLLWRMIMRIAFSWRAYGWRYGLGAAPRMLIGNLVSILAARRAVYLYIRSLLGKPLVWDKTQHSFPTLEKRP